MIRQTPPRLPVTRNPACSGAPRPLAADPAPHRRRCAISRRAPLFEVAPNLLFAFLLPISASAAAIASSVNCFCSIGCLLLFVVLVGMSCIPRSAAWVLQE
eukprot:m.133866 g.133866  ORF g.133866 m.133866 type:complete len:101 (+) comp52430_c0_seq2:1824-2126(+)